MLNEIYAFNPTNVYPYRFKKQTHFHSYTVYTHAGYMISAAHALRLLRGNHYAPSSTYH